MLSSLLDHFMFYLYNCEVSRCTNLKSKTQLREKKPHIRNWTSEKAKQTSKTCPVLKNGAPKFGQSMS